jgi:hypothetical protein
MKTSRFKKGLAVFFSGLMLSFVLMSFASNPGFAADNSDSKVIAAADKCGGDKKAEKKDGKCGDAKKAV